MDTQYLKEQRRKTKEIALDLLHRCESENLTLSQFNAVIEALEKMANHQFLLCNHHNP